MPRDRPRDRLNLWRLGLLAVLLVFWLVVFTTLRWAGVWPR